MDCMNHIANGWRRLATIEEFQNQGLTDQQATLAALKKNIQENLSTLSVEDLRFIWQAFLDAEMFLSRDDADKFQGLFKCLTGETFLDFTRKFLREAKNPVGEAFPLYALGSDDPSDISVEGTYEDEFGLKLTWSSSASGWFDKLVKCEKYQHSFTWPETDITIPWDAEIHVEILNNAKRGYQGSISVKSFLECIRPYVVYKLNGVTKESKLYKRGNQPRFFCGPYTAGDFVSSLKADRENKDDKIIIRAYPCTDTCYYNHTPIYPFIAREGDKPLRGCESAPDCPHASACHSFNK